MCIFCLFNGNMLFLVGVCAKVVLTFEGCCFFFRLFNCLSRYVMWFLLKKRRRYVMWLINILEGFLFV